MYQGRAAAPLDELSRLCGFAGKLGMAGDQVWGAYSEGRIEAIRNYCETDVVNTYLLYLRFQSMRGSLEPTAYARETALVRSTLEKLPEAHWREFLDRWAA